MNKPSTKTHLLSALNKLGQIVFIFFFFIICKATNAAFIQNGKLEHHHLEIKLSDMQPRIRLYVNLPKEKEKKKLSFVLDTGSNISLIRKNIFPQIGEQKSILLKSISGELDKEFTELMLDMYDEKLNLVSENSSFHAFDLDSKFNFDGILGNDVLEKFDVFLELPENAFLIKQSEIKINLNTKGFHRIPIEFKKGHILLKAKIGMEVCNFLLDTGAGISYMNQKKTSELNLKLAGKANFMDLRGEIQESNYHIAENLCVDENLCQKKIELLSGNSIEDFLSENEKLDGILGLNWIDKYSILIDYKNSSLYIKQR